MVSTHRQSKKPPRKLLPRKGTPAQKRGASKVPPSIATLSDREIKELKRIALLLTAERKKVGREVSHQEDEQPTEEDWTEIKRQALELIGADRLNPPGKHLAYVREKIEQALAPATPQPESNISASLSGSSSSMVG